MGSKEGRWKRDVEESRKGGGKKGRREIWEERLGEGGEKEEI